MAAAMPIPADPVELRKLRNAVIGSRTRKSTLVAKGQTPSLVALLTPPQENESSVEVVNLAATILGSLANSATPGVLLALLRARLPTALLRALGDLPSTPHLASLEALLRAVRSMCVCVAAYVSPGDKTRSSPRGRSVKELEGWSLAQAGFASASSSTAPAGSSASALDSLSDARSGLSSSTGNTYTFDGLSPTQELHLRCRLAIDELFAPSNLHLWLSALFISPTLPSRASTATSAFSSAPRLISSHIRPGSATAGPTRIATPDGSRAASRDRRAAGESSTSRAFSLAPPPALPVGLAPTLTGMDSSTSSMEGSANSHSGMLQPADRTRTLAIVEMVCSIISSCICIPGPAPPSGASQIHREVADTPEDELAARRTRVLDFRPDDSFAAQPPLRDVVGARKVVESAAFEQMPYHQGGERSARPERELFASLVQRSKSLDRTKDTGKAPERPDDELPQEDVTMTEPSLDASDAGLVAKPRNTLNVLLEAAECGFAKTQEVALWALAELSRENRQTSFRLFNCVTPSGAMPTTLLLNLRKETSAPVRLAAFSCLTHIIKVHPFSQRTHECVLSTLIDLTEETGEVQITAMFTFARLISDDPDLQMLATEHYDIIRRFGGFLEKTKSANSAPSAGPQSGAPRDEHLIRLREAVLTALAALAFQRDEIRRALVDATSPALLPLIVPSLTATDLGIRVAACRLVRALSRSISILRTSLVDAGVAEKLIGMIKDDNEDAEVKQQATATICNLVLKFSPMKQLLLEEGGIQKLVELARSREGGSTRLNALWALKNVLYSSETDTKRNVMSALGWDYVAALAADRKDEDPAAQEQALAIIRNLASSREEDIELTLSGFGKDVLLDIIEQVIWERHGDVITEQGAYIIVNIATGAEAHRRAILARPNILQTLVRLLGHDASDLRLASVWAALNLTQKIPQAVASAGSSPTRVFGGE
ncbi:ARM repeat-containing protein [Ceraceosorus guamensis]|uniref:ARM repeat-containing protein n=1 Tax=Ceraceosorus guamensis TaxID=1522189 RepID=A0A316W1L9_9BASI|nr:ARM repeat-containing protein [Ceraceosorus guamensis]PWN42663.1 ARM repeat-containing protein [Ceraceosorus guamensis]